MDDHWDLESLPDSDDEQKPATSSEKKKKKFSREDIMKILKGYEALPKEKWNALVPGQSVRVFTQKPGNPKFLFADYSQQMRSGTIKNLVKDGIFITAQRNGKTVYSQKILFKDVKRLFVFLSPGERTDKKRIDRMESQITMLKHRLDLLEKRLKKSS